MNSSGGRPTKEDDRRQHPCRVTIARKLAEDYKIEEARVLAIFDRMDATNWFSRPGGYFPHYDPFVEALWRLDTARALAMFEEEDLELLDQVKTIFDRLGSVGCPLRSLAELAENMATFRLHMLRTRERLLQTGHPQFHFWQDPWLEAMLGRLYYVKAPTAIRLADGTWLPWERSLGHDTLLQLSELGAQKLPLDDDNHVRLDYMWTSSNSHDHEDGGGQSPEHTCPSTVTYEACELLPELSPAEAQRLTDLRGKVFRIKFETLDHLSKALSAERIENLWEGFVRILRANDLLFEEVDFLFRIDRVYGRPDYRSPEDWSGETRLPGGLSDVLNIVFHCEREIRYRVFDSPRRILGGHVTRAGLASWRLDVDHFLDLFASEGHPELLSVYSEATRAHAEAHNRAMPLAKEFDERVMSLLESGLDTELSVRVPRKVKHLLSPYLRGEAIILKVPGNEEDEIANGPMVSPQDEVDGRYCFRRENDRFRVEFGPSRYPLFRASRGLEQIHHLLGRPGEWVHVLELSAVGKPETSVSGDREAARLGGNGGRSEGLISTDGEDLGPILDARARSEIQKRMEVLEEARAHAATIGELGKATDAEAEIEALKKHLLGAYGLCGRSRSTGGAAERARKAVRKAIGAAYKEIGHDEPVVKFLRASIKTGRFCRYTPPDDSPSWDL